MKFIDSHVHLGYSIPIDNIFIQMDESNVEKIVVFALPAEVDVAMNDYVLRKSEEYEQLIPFYYVVETEIP